MKIKRVLSLAIALVLAFPGFSFADESVDTIVIGEVGEIVDTSYTDPDGSLAEDTYSDVIISDNVDPEVGEEEADLGEETPSSDDGAVDSFVTYWFYVEDELYIEQTVKAGEEVNCPEAPVAPEGMAFVGWFLEDGTELFEDGPVVANFDTMDPFVNVEAQFIEKKSVEGAPSDEEMDSASDAEERHISNVADELAEDTKSDVEAPLEEAIVPDKETVFDADPTNSGEDSGTSTNDEEHPDENKETGSETESDGEKSDECMDEEADDANKGTDEEANDGNEVTGEEVEDANEVKDEEANNGNEEMDEEADGKNTDESPDAENTVADEDSRESIQPVRVTFVVIPENAIVSVQYCETPIEGQEIDESLEAQTASIPAEEDGSFLLPPGEYTYTAEAEGYVSAEAVHFVVAQENLTMEVCLDEAIEEVTEEVTEETSEPEDAAPAAFDQSMESNGVIVNVKADPGVFPEDAVLSVTRVLLYEQRQADAAVDEVRDEDVNVAVRYTFDIKVINPITHEEYQPADGQLVSVSFSLAEVADENLETQVYHITEEPGGMSAEALDVVTEDEVTATVEAEGFSIYTIEFTYNNLEFVIQGDTSVALSKVLNNVGLEGIPTAVEISRPELFSASDETGEWIISAHQAFDTAEWMRVTINGIVYEITVTDDQEITTWSELQTALNAGGTVTLTQDITAGENDSGLIINNPDATPNLYVTLDLNGHTIDFGRADNALPCSDPVILIQIGEWDSFSVIDSGNGGRITGGNNNGNGGGVAIISGSFSLHSGSITGNKARNGGGVWVGASGKFNMNGGRITQNEAECGGGVYVVSGGSTSSADGTHITDNSAYR